MLLATGFGSGLAPFAPGTFGTLTAIPVYLIIAGWPVWLYVGTVLTLFLGGIVICQIATQQLGEEDHPAIVWDEIVGYLITMFMIPKGWVSVLLGFLLFRIFDVLKPWPIGWLDRRLKGGLGIMLDDVFAGLYGLLLLQLSFYLMER